MMQMGRIKTELTEFMEHVERERIQDELQDLMGHVALTLNSQPRPDPEPKDPKLSTPNHKPEAINQKPETRNQKLSTLNPKPQPLNRKPKTRNPTGRSRVKRLMQGWRGRGSKKSSKSSWGTLPQPQSLNPQPSTPNPQLSTLNPQPSTLNPQPSTLNPRT